MGLGLLAKHQSGGFSLGVVHQHFGEVLAGGLLVDVELVDVSVLLEEVLADQVVSVSGSDVQRRIAHVLGLLVRVLTFAYHDPDGVEVAFLASFPDVCKK